MMHSLIANISCAGFFPLFLDRSHEKCKTEYCHADHKDKHCMSIGQSAYRHAAEFHEHGLPVVGFMSNPPYMFFPEDSMAAVATDQLVPTANVIASILRTEQ
jgi:hypothetical protein